MRWVNVNDMAGKAHLINLAQVIQVVTEPTQYKVFLNSLESFSIGKDQFQILLAAITKSNEAPA
jgi:hypothetical protein